MATPLVEEEVLLREYDNLAAALYANSKRQEESELRISKAADHLVQELPNEFLGFVIHGVEVTVA